MFGLEGSGFIVAIAVTVLLAGAIVYYCNSRITAMEKAIVKQNQVLADFIGNVRNTLTNVPSGGTSGVKQQNVVANGATQEAVDAANDYYSNTTPENKIEVSDDSQSEDDSDSDSDSESDLSSNNENNEKDDNIQEVSENLEVSNLTDVDIEVIGFAMTPPDGPPPPDISGPEITEITELNHLDETTTPIDNEIKTINLGDVKDEEELDSVTANSETLSSVSNGSNDEDDEEEDDDLSSALSNTLVTELNDSNVMKLKVARLREIALELKLASEASVKKTKKAALQTLIKNKINNTQ